MPLQPALRLLLTALLLVGAVRPARALQLGETKAQTLARHGAPSVEDRGRNLAMYFWEGWSAQLEYEKDSVRRLTYRRGESFQESDLAALLQSNGGANRWREISAAASTRRWMRDDGATAECVRSRPVVMIFRGGQSAALPVTAIPFAPATFPKLAPSAPPAPVAENRPPPAAEPGHFPKLTAKEISPPSLAKQAPEPLEQRPLPGPGEPAPAPLPAPSGFPLAPFAILGGLAALLGLLKSTWRTAAQRRASPCPPGDSATPAPTQDAVPAGASGLAGLRWDQFELLVGEVFRREGCIVELSEALGPDDGIDLTLRRGAETILVQCKHWRTSKIAAREVREFYGAMAASGTPGGVFVTTGAFTRDAQEFAAGKGIELLDGAALQARLAAVTQPGENLCAIGNWIDEFRAHARIFEPECPVCRTAMVRRQNRVSGAPFWGCRSFPRCPGKRDPRLDLLPAPLAA